VSAVAIAALASLIILQRWDSRNLIRLAISRYRSPPVRGKAVLGVPLTLRSSENAIMR